MLRFSDAKGIIIFIFVCALFSGSIFAASGKSSYELRRKRKSSFVDLNNLKFSTSLATTVTMNEDRELSNLISMAGSYSFEKKHTLTLKLSFEKTYPKTLGPNENEFFIHAPELSYSYSGIFKYGNFSIDALILGVQATSDQAYKNTSQIARLRAGGAWSLKLVKDLNFSHTLLVDKYLNKYMNGVNGTYIDYRFINSFGLSYALIKNLSVSAGLAFIHKKKYGGAFYLNRLYSFGGSYSLPKGWSLSAVFESVDDFSAYATNKFEIYNNDNSTFTFTIGKSF